MKKSSFFMLLIFTFISLITYAQNIYEASRAGDISRIGFLMSLNPDTINKPDERGFSPLIIACYRNHAKVVQLLLSNGVDVNFHSPEGTALIGTCYKGNLEIAKLLLDYKADVNAQNEQGTTALIFAVEANNPELVSLLLKSGAKKEVKEKSGQTALDYAKANQYTEIKNLLSK